MTDERMVGELQKRGSIRSVDAFHIGVFCACAEIQLNEAVSCFAPGATEICNFYGRRTSEERVSEAGCFVRMSRNYRN